MFTISLYIIQKKNAKLSEFDKKAIMFKGESKSFLRGGSNENYSVDVFVYKQEA